MILIKGRWLYSWLYNGLIYKLGCYLSRVDAKAGRYDPKY